MALNVFPPGIEPGLQDPQSCVLSIKLWEQFCVKLIIKGAGQVERREHLNIKRS